MRECELCNRPARMFCESDEASLCWNCDAKVHSANFLVARHSRNLLCHICQSPTPWKASGAKLGPTISVCDRCTASKNTLRRLHHREEEEEGNGENEQDNTEDEDEDEEEEIDDDADDDDEEDGENQVVPWSSTPPPPPVPSSSSSEEESSSRHHHHASASSEIASPLKRTRENADLGSQDDLDCSSSQRRAVCSIKEESVSLRSIPPLNDGRKIVTVRSESRSGLIELESLQRFQREEEICNDDDQVLDLCCNLNKDPTAVDLVSTASP